MVGKISCLTVECTWDIMMRYNFMLMLFYSLYFVFITELIYCLTLAFFTEEPVIVTLPEGLGACTPFFKFDLLDVILQKELSRWGILSIILRYLWSLVTRLILPNLQAWMMTDIPTSHPCKNVVMISLSLYIWVLFSKINNI